MGNTIDPLTSLIQQFPIQALIAATFLLGFFAWLIAFEEQLRRLTGQRRLTEMQMQLDELRSDIRRLEAQGQSLVVRFLNLPKSSSSSTVTPDEKNSSIDPAPEIELVPEGLEIAPHEKTGPETNSKIRSERAMARRALAEHDVSASAFLGLVVVLLLIGLVVTAYVAGGPGPSR